jgi:hypothetical protein
MSTRQSNNSQNSEGQKEGKLCLMATGTIITSVMMAGQDVTMGLPKTANLAAHSADGVWGDPPCLEEGTGRGDAGKCPLHTRVFVAKITDEFIPGLEVLHANYTLTDFGCHAL